MEKIHVCPECRSSRRWLDQPHAPRYSRAPCGHVAMVDCMGRLVRTCGECGRLPDKRPDYELEAAKKDG